MKSGFKIKVPCIQTFNLLYTKQQRDKCRKETLRWLFEFNEIFHEFHQFVEDIEISLCFDWNEWIQETRISYERNIS